ncbi:NAD(P)-dependent oxidoreductase [Ramlibacter terrae]|uniref:NAD(P)-dependent oxidoreductase n=1 Tax=Ramlibacter terrae TaxID=2732511 RepID=A0ABX6P5I7_9BURK|nr:NAD(P)-dependent oxidoreductase [Ramlibacter terrae]
MTPFGKDSRIGFIGLGVMGGGMAHNLLRKGHELHVYARRAEACDAFVQAGAQREATPADVGRASELVILCLSDDDAVEAVLFGPDGLASGLSAGACVIDTSTISASSARIFGKRLAEAGVTLLDAPVSGGQQGAEAGTLAAMVGGPAEQVEACREVMSAFCKGITHVGELGAGQTVKACNQVAVAGALLGVADAFALALAQGVDAKVMRDVLLGGTARSFALEKHGQRVLDGDFQPGFRARLMRKDLRIALQTGRDAGARLSGAAAAERLLDALCEGGRADWDWSAMALQAQAEAGLPIPGTPKKAN